MHAATTRARRTTRRMLDLLTIVGTAAAGRSPRLGIVHLACAAPGARTSGSRARSELGYLFTGAMLSSMGGMNGSWQGRPSMGVTHRESTAPSAVEADVQPTAPGIVLNGAAIVLFVFALWRGSERGGDLGSIMLIAAGWFILLLYWLFWSVTVADERRIDGRHLVRWVLAPSLFVLAAALVFGGYALEARFWLSRSALDEAADSALAGVPVAPGWIGLYPVDEVSVEDETTVRFVIPGQHSLVRATERRTDRSLVYESIEDDWSFEVDASDWFID
jgi:hypothetical protein